MRNFSKQQAGVTLLEVILFLVVAGAILYFSLQQYLSFRSDTDAIQLKSNVDTLFRGAGLYFRAQCAGTINPTTHLINPGALNPNNTTTPPGNNVVLNVGTDLISKSNFIPANSIPSNPIVDTSVANTWNGYVVQFNTYSTAPPRFVCVNGTNTTDPYSPNCNSMKLVGTSSVWQIQVSVAVKDPTLALDYLNMLGADCLSSMNGTIVAPCPVFGNGTGNFLVWTRAPSMAAPGDSAVMPDSNTQQFKQMYMIYPINYLLNNGGSTADNSMQYYLCGG